MPRNTSNSPTRSVEERSSSPISLERKLELLESRFTQPNNNSNSVRSNMDPPQPQQPMSFGNDGTATGSPTTTSNSEHSFSFGSPNGSTGTDHSSTSNLPSSAVRSRRRPSLSSSLHAVERAAARHLRKVQANSPVAGTSSNSTFSINSSTGSQQTLLTSHVQKHNSQQQQFQRVVAESPASNPVPVTPHGDRATAAAATKMVPPKPAAVRNILHPQASRNAPASSSTALHNPSNGNASSNNAANPKRKSVPKRKTPSVKDKSSNNNYNTSLASPEPTKRSRTGDPPAAFNTTELLSRSPRMFSELSRDRDRSNPAKSSSTSVGISTGIGNSATKKLPPPPPANNRRIHDFFSAATKKKEQQQNGQQALVSPHPTTNSNNNTTTTSTTNNFAHPLAHAHHDPHAHASSLDWQAKYTKLQQLLQDKEEQLKAVTNNKTILHTALQTALQQTKQELSYVKSQHVVRQGTTATVLEDLLRWKSGQQAKELRERLATDGARLGRIVYARAGMRALESWEEGYATKDLEQRKKQFKEKRKALELRLQQQQQQQHNADSQEQGKENSQNTNVVSALEAMEAKESIQMHMRNLREKDQELAHEEQALNDEKGAHIRALKLVASEDSSRFRSRPKLHDRYVLHCLLGKGGFSEVWRGYDLVELREVAVKIHQLDPRWPDSKKENYTKHVSREYEIHRQVRHSRIVSLYDVFEIDNNSFATVLECCKGTDLDSLLKTKKRLPERQARAILLQILSGMSYLSQPSGNRQGIIHYDLKPGNILFDEIGDAKITDFGLSKIVDTPDPAESMELTSQGAGTYWYLPPECFVTTGQVRISNKVDVWSIGVIYYQMLFGVRPFGEGKSQDKLLSDHTMLNAQQVNFPDRPQVSDEGKTFLRQCLMYDQAFRPTIAQLCENSYVLGPTK